ncbi:hypothetical protein DOTSEDRAFT_151194 [Dothistroma septosporum NZE10]|uniref:Versicolorin reductase 1 n=1 Tax=Dothistroma septosporum (strain NZE10 / CBS 128990) TaxID=675120 RepID=N1PMV5_DOTSN|nr:hypothetical protein DOTSEDRAFT_151194 [Dothistroma septosporum NZE10]
MGRQVALAYARAGITGLTLGDLSEKGIAETQRLLEAEFPHVKTLAVVLDVTDEQMVNDMVDQAVHTFGTLDCAANAAGVIVNTRSKAAEVPPGEYDRVMNINARAVVLCMQAEARVMLKQPRRLTSSGWKDERRGQVGSIVNFSSVCGVTAMPNVMPYIASKHAVLGFTKAAAIEHAPDGLRINAVCPAIVDTPFIDNIKALKNGNLQDPIFANPMGRLCLPDEIADAVIFLSSTMSSYVSGLGLVVDGGKTMQY